MKFSDAAGYLLYALLTLVSTNLHAVVTFELTLLDEDNSGFFDNTPTTAVGGNTGTTRGEQRRIALNYALDILSETLTGSVPIQINAQFQPLELDSDFLVIAAASPKALLRDFTGAPKSNTWYPSALANQYAGQDLTQQNADIDAEFDPSIDSNLNDGISWYYGLDGLAASNQLDFVTVALHELVHGLGFISVLDYRVTNRIASVDLYDDRPDIFSSYFQKRNASPLALLDMNSVQRASALTATGNLQWRGSAGRYIGFGFQNGVNGGNIQFYAPGIYEPGSSTSHTSNAVTPNDLMEPAYYGANHDLGIGAAVLADIGWGNYTDLVAATILLSEPIAANTDYAVQLKIVNNGVQHADNLILNYTLPSNTTLVTITSPQGSCDISNNPIRCDLGTLNKRATLTLSAIVNSSANSNLIHKINVISDIIEADISNNNRQVIGQFGVNGAGISSEAGSDIQTLTGQSVTLNGSSNDPQASFQWLQLSGQNVSLNNSTSANPSFIAPQKSGVLLFKLTATNAQQDTASSTVNIYVNRAPIANAGADQIVDRNTNVTFNALESADDTAIVSYQWQQTAGANIDLINKNTATPNFMSPNTSGDLAFELMVTDDLGQSATDTVQLTVIDSNADDQGSSSAGSAFKDNKGSGSLDFYWILLGVLLTQQRRRKGK
jgi:hypothetical protein